jgi:hypothetical protein
MGQKPSVLTIYAAHTDDANEGSIWIPEPHLPTRTLVKVCNPKLRRAVICQARHIDDNFLDERKGKHKGAAEITDKLDQGHANQRMVS